MLAERDTARAAALQRQWSQMIRFERLAARPQYIAGADVAFSPDGKDCLGCMVLLSYPELELLECVGARRPVGFPYVPGLLSFREVPVLLDAAGQLSRQPDLLLVDGQGWAHPRRFGLACHLGLQLDWPTIGCAKSRLIGQYDEVLLEKGAWQWLEDKNERIGAVLRTRYNVKCLFVSVGHRVMMTDVIDLVISSCSRYRLPEPTRWAHRFVTKMRTDGVDKIAYKR